MVTSCSHCGKLLVETKDTFLLCKKCSIFVPKGAQSFNKLKGRINEMEVQMNLDGKVVEKKEPKAVKWKQIIELAGQGMNQQQIQEKTGFKMSYIKTILKIKQPVI